ncbi:MAG: Stp1/IreP family PP2C-type Ser/Thr phosphatase, partial [Acidimicrobiales bacterium]|nr:Stp1/IreP family PP2C-type Ser/Thr phosphatase [Acidimicrobiales bacterium]
MMFRPGAAEDIGQVRQSMQDAVLVAANLFAVADGMGGHRGGEIAARIAIETLAEHFTEPNIDLLVDAVQKANDAIVARADAEPGLRGMGTTICAMAVVGEGDAERIGVVNVGDSRLYLLPAGANALEQITEDHSLVATLERQGQLTKEEAAVHPHRNILTRALGIDPKVMVDSWEVMPCQGDRYLLCSDGLFNEVEDGQIADVLRNISDPEQAAKTLVDLANANGGRDNISVVVVDVIAGVSGRAQPEQRILKAVHGSERVLASPEVQESVERVSASVTVPADGVANAAGEVELRTSRLTWRLVAFIALFFAVLGVGAYAVTAVANNTFFVGFHDDEVTIFRGRPGGVLWFKPSVEERTGIRRDEVPQQFLSDLRKGKDEATLEDARRYVQNIRTAAGETAASLGGAVGDVSGTGLGGNAGSGGVPSAEGNDCLLYTSP